MGHVKENDSLLHQGEEMKLQNNCINYRAFLHEFSLLNSIFTR